MHTKIFVLLLAIGLAGTCMVNAQSPTPSPSRAKHPRKKAAAAAEALLTCSRRSCKASAANLPAAAVPGKRKRIPVKYWEFIADNLSKSGWSWGCVATVDREGRTIWIADAHRDDGKRFVVHADEKLTAFLELERAVCIHLLTEQI